jgi:Flp pilus assembly protein TadG
MIRTVNKIKSNFVAGNTFNKFRNDSKGTVAVIFAITLLPVLLAVGLAVDYSVASNTKAKLDSAADAAALNAVIKTKAFLADNQNKGLSDAALTSQALAYAKKEAGLHFDGNANNVVRTRDIRRDVTVDIKNRSVTASVLYNADVNLAFGPLIQMNDFHVSNKSVAAAPLPEYLDLFVILDNSGSMGIGATGDDIEKMRAVNGNCAVACHAGGDPSYNTIKARTGVDKITMRIDVLRDAMTGMLSQANSIKTTADLFRFNLFAFSNDLVPLQAASTDYTVLKNAISGLDLDNREGGTNFHFAIGSQLPDVLPSSQDGSSALRRKTHVIIITDGVENNRLASKFCLNIGDQNFVPWYGNSNPYQETYGYTNDCGKKQISDTIQAFNPRICDVLKNKGAQVTVLDVKYIVPSSVSGDIAKEFAYVQNNILGREATTIAGCASSSSDYYSANTPSEIKSAVNAIFGNILKPIRLIN